MVRIDVRYEGDLRCTCVHEPSAAELLTDAPKDNHGLGRSFSPTDLLATSLGSCMLTIMGLAARRHGLALDGATCQVEKQMATEPRRRIGRLRVAFHVPVDPGEEGRALLRDAADGCPVKASLAPDTLVEISWRWGP